MLVVVGNDKIGRKFINQIDQSKFMIVLDESSSVSRVFKLLKNGSLNFSQLFQMFFSDLLRKNYPLTKKYEAIKNNSDLINIIKKNNIKTIVLYRGGLIISKKIIDMNIRILNIHCAKIPEYGGIGSIQRALKDKAYNQEATLHVITEAIDRGEIIASTPYTLNNNFSYLVNENIAYDAGIKLFNTVFRNV